MLPIRRFAGAVAAFALLVTLAYAGLAGIGGWTGAGDALAQTAGTVPGNTLGSSSDAEIWRAIRQGQQGTVSIQDEMAGILIQSEGDNWRAWRNGPLSLYGAWAMLGVIAVLALFFLIRGRIRIDAGPSGRLIERFNSPERFAHWLLATSFIILALTGLNLMYGRYVILPVIGPELFSTLTQLGKYAHNYVGFAFMLALVMILVLWIRHNIPNRHDMVWLAKAGGMLKKGVHPPAKKFNAGQKILFWLILLGGASISVSGIALMFPFEFEMFAGTFAVLNIFGFGLPTELTPIQALQYSQLWHALMGLFLIAVVIGHIYIGTIGMEGAFDAMGSGKVDSNWAKEHHSLWAAEAKPSESGGDD